MCAVCGDQATLSINSTPVAEAHQFTLNWASNEQDVRTFDPAKPFGEWLACAENGTLEIRTYDYICASVDPGTEDIEYICNCSSATFSGNCMASSINIAVDAKGIVEYSHVFRLTGDISIS
jgi:hypothetical protein